MKLKRYLLFIYMGIAGSFLSGCLKETDSVGNTILNQQPANLVELLRRTEQLASQTTVLAITLTPNPAEENVLLGYVRFASPELPKMPVTVKLKLNNSLLPTGYTALPANAYSLVTPLDQMTITPGTRMAEIRIVLKKASLNPAATYGLGFEIDDPGAGNVVNGRARIFMVSPRVR